MFKKYHGFAVPEALKSMVPKMANPDRPQKYTSMYQILKKAIQVAREFQI